MISTQIKQLPAHSPLRPPYYANNLWLPKIIAFHTLYISARTVPKVISSFRSCKRPFHLLDDLQAEKDKIIYNLLYHKKTISSNAQKLSLVVFVITGSLFLSKFLL